MSTMTDKDETYNGYANRETWAFNLHWQNDQGLYNETLDRVREASGRGLADGRTIEEATDHEIGELVVNYWRDTIDCWEAEMGTSVPDGLRMFDREVGSWWRIDYREVGEAVRESLDTES